MLGFLETVGRSFWVFLLLLLLLCFVLWGFIFETGSLYEALAVLYTGLASNSQIHLPLPLKKNLLKWGLVALVTSVTQEPEAGGFQVKKHCW